jgi:hypothetical protein
MFLSSNRTVLGSSTVIVIVPNGFEASIAGLVPLPSAHHSRRNLGKQDVQEWQALCGQC